MFSSPQSYSNSIHTVIDCGILLSPLYKPYNDWNKPQLLETLNNPQWLLLTQAISQLVRCPSWLLPALEINQHFTRGDI